MSGSSIDICNCIEAPSKCACCHEVYKCPSGLISCNVNIAKVQRSHLLQYLNFLETDKTIQLFMYNDFCYIQADKYLIATVFKYFLRLGLQPDMYTKEIFFKTLHLALEICEEANEDAKYTVYVWATELGTANDPVIKRKFRNEKLQIFLDLDGRGIICKEWCDDLFRQAPDHPLFKRTRKAGHSGAFMRRLVMVKGKPYYIRNTGSCSLCGGEDDPNLEENGVQ